MTSTRSGRSQIIRGVMAAAITVLSLTACGGQDVPSAGHPVTKVSPIQAPTSAAPKTAEALPAGATPVPTAGEGKAAAIATFGEDGLNAAASRVEEIIALAVADCERFAAKDSADPTAGFTDLMTPSTWTQFKADPYGLAVNVGSQYDVKPVGCAGQVRFAENGLNVTGVSPSAEGLPQITFGTPVAVTITTKDGSKVDITNPSFEVGAVEGPDGQWLLSAYRIGAYAAA
jgi:hypothetical protein